MIIGASGGKALHINLEKLVEGRLLVQANSGAGKSWALRRLLEQSYGNVQQIVIDVEDEFYTLREKYDYVLAGRQGGDCPADVRSAALLARRLLELGTSAIIGIFELKVNDRTKFVKLFLDSLIDSPRSLWHPALVVVDESQLFCPEKGHGEAESTSSVIDLMTRGRKRGFCGVLATTRISKLSKDACEVNNKLIGRSALDVDMARSAKELGFGKGRELELRSLNPGEFFAFGPAISDVVTRVMVGPVVTTHPKSGQQIAPPAPPRDKVRAVLAQLADLPKEAEEEVATIAGLKQQVTTLKRELAAAKSEQPPVPSVEIMNAEFNRGAESVLAEVRRDLDIFHACGKELQDLMRQVIDGMKTSFMAEYIKACDKLTAVEEQWRPPDTLAHIIERTKEKGVPKPSARPASTITLTLKEAEIIEKKELSGSGVVLTSPEQRILDALAWLESIGTPSPTNSAVAFVANYSVNGGGYRNPRGRLRTRGLIDYSGEDTLSLTDSGRALANAPQPVTGEELRNQTLARMPSPERKILQVLIDTWPAALTNDQCAARSGYDARGGGYRNPRGALRTLGLITYPSKGMVKASDFLFIGG